MFRLLLLLVLLVAAAALVIWAGSLPGGVTLDLGSGTIIELNFAAAGIALAITGGLAALAWWLIGGVFLLPGRFRSARAVSRSRKANRALADALLAAEAGDAPSAKKLHKKAERYADDDRLKLLLEARIAEVTDRWDDAERAWAQLARLPGGQLAGLRGSALAAIERGDKSAAELRAREALDLKTTADWPFNSLFDLQVSRGEWATALETLTLGEQRGLISGDSLRRRRAVLLTAKAATLGADERQAAQRLLADAIRAAPGFPPAAWHGARHLMVDGKVKAADNLLQLAWKSRPHPGLAQLARRIEPDAPPPKVAARLEALAAANPLHRESRILKAEVHIDQRRWGEAVKALALLIEERATARLCLLMERALKGYGDPAEADKWARMAATASREADWSDLDPQGGAFDYETKDWARLVYAFGDVGDLIHARHESFGRELEAGRMNALPAPVSKTEAPTMPKAATAALEPPKDFVDGE